MSINKIEMHQFDDIQAVNDVERLIILRKRLGNMRQYELARELGVTPSYLVGIENFRYPFTNSLRQKLNQFLIQKQSE